MSRISLSSRSRIFSIDTAMPWGISLSISLNIFSLIISAASTLSGWSVRVSSGKKWGDSNARRFISSTSSSICSPFDAQTGTTASKSKSSLSWTILARSSSLSFIISILLIARITGTFSFLNFSRSSYSPFLMSPFASTTKRQASTPPMESPTAWFIFSPSLLWGLW